MAFWNVQQLMDVKRELLPALRRNRAKAAAAAYEESLQQAGSGSARLQVLLLHGALFVALSCNSD